MNKVSSVQATEDRLRVNMGKIQTRGHIDGTVCSWEEL